MIFELIYWQLLNYVLYKDMVEKFDNKDAKNGNFINQMEFRKKYNKNGMIITETTVKESSFRQSKLKKFPLGDRFNILHLASLFRLIDELSFPVLPLFEPFHKTGVSYYGS